MAVTWTAGSIFGLVWLLVWVPLFLVSTGVFWSRRFIQPIKARSPALVLITDAMLVLYTILLCFQRIFVSEYPCILNMWSGYIGTIILLNSYLWRCWTLYYNFNLTHVRLQSDADTEHNFFLTHRYLTSSTFLSRLSLSVFVLLMIWPFVLTFTHETIRTSSGDGCDQGKGPVILAVYVAVYVFLFMVFSWGLRSVADNFKIKEELRATGLIALLAVIPWFVFNNYAKDLNTHTFPFSTLFLLIAVAAAFTASTIYPLYLSYANGGNGGVAATTPLVRGGGGADSSSGFHNLAINDTPVGDVATPERLFQILDDPAGAMAFMRFLTKEFSVENIMFYQEVEAFRSEVHEAGPAEQRDEDSNQRLALAAHKLYTKYISPNAPFQVNLPSGVLKNCELHLRWEAHKVGLTKEMMDMPHTRQRHEGVVAIHLPSAGPAGGAAAAAANGAAAGGKKGDPAAIELEDWSSPPPAQKPPMAHLNTSTATIFDDAQAAIYMLMEKDSMQRFVRNDLFKQWIKNKKDEARKKQVLQEMNLA